VQKIMLIIALRTANPFWVAPITLNLQLTVKSVCIINGLSIHKYSNIIEGLRGQICSSNQLHMASSYIIARWMCYSCLRKHVYTILRHIQNTLLNYAIHLNFILIHYTMNILNYLSNMLNTPIYHHHYFHS